MKRYYSLDLLESLYRQQEPCSPENRIKEQAKILQKGLNTLDTCWARSNRRFYAHIQLYEFI